MTSSATSTSGSGTGSGPSGSAAEATGAAARLRALGLADAAPCAVVLLAGGDVAPDAALRPRLQQLVARGLLRTLAELGRLRSAPVALLGSADAAEGLPALVAGQLAEGAAATAGAAPGLRLLGLVPLAGAGGSVSCASGSGIRRSCRW